MFGRDLIDGKSGQTDWANDSTDSASRYISDSYADLDPGKQQDEAKIVGIRDGNANDGDVKLVASQGAGNIGALKTDPTDSVDDLFCEHTQQCDCHKPKTKPKLPFAEPVEPPTFASQTPPSGLINQPLTPILFDEQSRKIQTTAVDDANNSLRRSEPLSYEKVATLTDKQSALDLVEAEPNLVQSDLVQSNLVQSNLVQSNPLQSNPARFNPSQDRTDETVRASAFSQRSDEAELVMSNHPDPKTGTPSVCVSCQDASCDGNCSIRTKRKTTPGLRPIVDSEPIVIVATTSSDTIPPFADFPRADESAQEAIDDVVELEIVMPESVLPSDTEIVATEPPMTEPATESFDDLSDDDWLAMFGPMTANGQSCPECESNQCQDPSCQTGTNTGLADTKPVSQPMVARTSHMVVTVSDDEAAPVPRFAATQPASKIGKASQISSASTPESSNDFQPVAHTADVGNIEIEIELPTWGQPQTSIEPAPETPIANPTPVSQFQPTVESKTIELPLLAPTSGSGSVSVPDAGLVRNMPRPAQIYRGPPVRFEIIDNTVPWDVKLSETIQNVKTQLSIETEPSARNGLEVNLRLLEVLQRQMADVEVRNDSLSDKEKQYWKHQLDAIALMLKSNDSADSDQARHNAAIDTLAHLRKAVERLESIAEMRVSNCEFCTEVSGFGKFKAFPTTTFSPSQPMLVYCEVENYSSMQRQVNLQTEVHTRLRGSYVIYDQQGRAVQQAVYPIVEDIARKRRRDFYMHFPIRLKNLAPGEYKLELLVEDMNGNKTGSVKPGMDFRVK